MDNAKSGTMLYMYGWYILISNARAGDFFFFLLKTWLFRLDSSFFGYYSISQVLLKIGLKIVKEFLRKSLFFKSHNVSATGYYGIEDPFPVLGSLRRANCGLSRATEGSYHYLGVAEVCNSIFVS